MRRIFVVLGMHRGGTSAVARSLPALGVSLGEAMLPARPDNPSGFWEDRDVVALNDKVFAALGLEWHSLACISEDALGAPSLDALRSEASALLEARLAGARAWGFKDPRTSRLLGFWEPVLAKLHLEPVRLIAVRNPLSVATSLQTRDGLRPEKGLLLWALHMVPLLRYGVGPWTAVVDYDRLLADPEAELARIAPVLGLSTPGPEAAAAYARDFLTLKLRHAQFGEADLAADARVIQLVTRACKLFQRMARDEPVAGLEIAQLEGEFADLMPLIEFAGALERQGIEQARLIGQLIEDGGIARSLLAEMEGEVAKAGREQARMRQDLSEREALICSLEVDRNDLRAAIAFLRSQAAELIDRCERLGHDLEVSRQEAAEAVDDLRTTVFELDSRYTRCLAPLAETSGALAQVRERHAKDIGNLCCRISIIESELFALREAAARRPSMLGRFVGPLLATASEFARLADRFRAVLADDGFVAAMKRAAEFLKVKIDRQARIAALAPRPLRSSSASLPVTSIVEMRARGPTVSILMPVHNTAPEILEDAIRSVLGQTYPNWELCICDDCSSNQGTLAVLDRYRGVDWRIKIVTAPQPLHIARATNSAAELATGEFVGFLDHDDLLEPDALEHVCRALGENPEIDVLYTDEDKLESDGRFTEPYLKPDWSPEHLLSVMYILHFMVVRKRLFLELGGLRHDFTGSQDYDLALRATAKARAVAHVPRILYHWRKVPGSAAAVVDAKPEALRNARRALVDFVTTSDPLARVEDGLLPGTHRVQWSIGSDPVTLLILTGARSRNVEGRGRILLVENFIDSILARSTYPDYRMLVIDDDGNLPANVRAKVEGAGGRIVSFPSAAQFNFSAKMNFGLSQVTTEHVILLNDDLEVITRDWIESLLSFSAQRGVGAVGARLLYPSGRLQHAGVVLGVNGSAAHLFHNLAPDAVGYCGYTHIVRNFSAVTGAVLATRMSIVRKVGNFDERLAIDFNDIDFCLRVGAAGLRVVYTPYAQLYHFEGSSLARSAQDPSERDRFLRRWKERVDADPFYHPLLPRDRLDCETGTLKLVA